MAEEQAAPKQPFESRVEDLFSSAVEQQVAERRALGSAMREISELVGTLQGELTRISHRLDSLEVRVGQDGRGVREAATAVQEGLEVAVARLTTAVTDQLDAAQRRDDEARTSLQRAVLAAVSQAASHEDEGAVDRLGERIGQLERLVAELASRPAVDVPAAPSAEAVAAAVQQRLPRPIEPDDIAAAVIGRMPQPERQDPAGLAEATARAVLANLPQPGTIDAAGIADAVADAVARAVPRPEPLDVGHLAARLAAAVPPPVPLDPEALVAAIAGAVTPPSADELASAIAERLPAGDIDDVTSALLDVSRRHQQELTTTLVRELQLRLDLVADEVRDSVDGASASLRTGLEALRQDANDAARRQTGALGDEALSATRQVVQEAITPAVEAVGALRDDLQQPWGMLDRLSVRIDGVVQTVDELRHQLDTMPERLSPLEHLGDVRQRVSAMAHRIEELSTLAELPGLVAGLAERQVSPERLAEVRDLVAGVAERQVSPERLAEVRDLVAELVERQVSPERLAEVRDLVAELVERQGRFDEVEARIDAVSARLGRLDEVLVATNRANERLAGLDELAVDVGGLREQLTGLGDVGEAVEATHDRLVVLDQVLLGLASVQERVAELDGRVHGVVEDLGARTEAAATGLQSAVESVLRADQLGREAAAQDLLASVDERVDSLTTSVAERLDAVGGQLQATLHRLETGGDEARADLRDLVGRSDEAGAALEGLGGQVRALEGDIEGQAQTLAAMGADIGRVGVTVGRLIGELQAKVLSDQERIAAQVRALLVESVQELDRAGAGMTAAAQRAATVLDQSTAESARVLDEAASRAVVRLEEALDTGTERVDDVATAASDVLRGTTADVVSRLDDATGAILDSSETLREQLVAMLKEVTGEARLQTAKAARRLEDSADRLDGLYDAVQGFEPALVDYLIERDRQLDQQRVLLLRDLVEQLGASLTRRERKRLAGRLEPPSAPTPDGPGPFKPRAERRPTAAAPADEPADEPEGPHDVSPPPPQRVVARSRGPVAHREDLASLTAPPTPSRSAPRPRLSRDDLLGVKGLGPARIAALVDEFGSIEAIGDASVDQLARVDGISPSLARAILAAVEALSVD